MSTLIDIDLWCLMFNNTLIQSVIPGNEVNWRGNNFVPSTECDASCLICKGGDTAHVLNTIKQSRTQERRERQVASLPRSLHASIPTGNEMLQLRPATRWWMSWLWKWGKPITERPFLKDLHAECYQYCVPSDAVLKHCGSGKVADAQSTFMIRCSRKCNTPVVTHVCPMRP